MKAVLVCGARPNFMKIAPLLRAIARFNEGSAGPAVTASDRSGRGSRPEPGSQPPFTIHRSPSASAPAQITPLLVHTGQHYDFQMSQVFFQDLELPEPDIYLGVGSGTHAGQTARVMVEFEKLLLEHRPDLVVVVGDVNSTLAAALAAVKVQIPVAHVEAGLRSGDRTMPEEINRLLTDQISDYLFTPSPDADENLKREGVAGEKIFFVGNVMIDSLLYNRPPAEKSDILERLGLGSEGYALLTLHRPSNVDDRETLSRIMSAITRISERIPVVFPAHPRTLKNLREFGLLPEGASTGHDSQSTDDAAPPAIHHSPFTIHHLVLTAPLSYLDFLKLEMYARLVMTDSGGIQEETTVLNVPCLTLRENTERPITITHGTNVLVGTDPERIIEEAFRVLSRESDASPVIASEARQSRPVPEPCIDLWDGHTAERIVEVLARTA